MLPIEEIVSKLALDQRHLVRCSEYGYKLKLSLLADSAIQRRGKLILVTATNPTKAGEGKTVVSIGLAQALEQLGKSAIVTLRQPSLGPVFGQKGGGTGGGRASVEPAAKINLHFHGDFHAIAAAHNLLAAVIDAHIFHGNELDLEPDQITWPRTIDVNDRALRHVAIGGTKSSGLARNTGFIITAAYHLWAMQRMFLGKFREEWRQNKYLEPFGGKFPEINGRELLTLAPLAILVLVLGFWPRPLLSATDKGALEAHRAVDRPGQAQIAEAPALPAHGVVASGR